MTTPNRPLLSPAAWQVSSAASVAKDHCENPIAAALLAIADQVEHHWDGTDCIDHLRTIAAELEGTNG